MTMMVSVHVVRQYTGSIMEKRVCLVLPSLHAGAEFSLILGAGSVFGTYTQVT